MIKKYDVLIHGYDWGPAVDQIILQLKEETTVSVLNPDEFVLQVTKGYYQTHLSQKRGIPDADLPDNFIVETTACEITTCFFSDATGKAIKDGVASYITLHLAAHPDYQHLSPFVFNLHTFMNEKASVFTFTINTMTDFMLPSTYHYCNTEKFSPLQTFVDDAVTIHYTDYKPPTKQQKHPLIIWLHGVGEGGVDKEVALMGNRVTAFVEEKIQTIFDGAYILIPQAKTFWLDDGNGAITKTGQSLYTEQLKTLIIEYIEKHPEIDQQRIYLGGCSNGGFMTMNMLFNYPELFTAAFPICHYYRDEWVTDEMLDRIKNIPIWFTQAANDPTVIPAEHIRPTYKRLQPIAQQAYLSYLPDVHDLTGTYQKDGAPYQYNGHLSWIPVLNNMVKTTINNKEITIMEWLASLYK